MAYLVKADGTTDVITGEGDDGHLTYEQIRKLIGGGFVEHVDTDPKQAMGCAHIYLDEEGKLKGFPPNVKATEMSVYTQAGDTLVGDVLFCTDDEDMS